MNVGYKVWRALKCVRCSINGVARAEAWGNRNAMKMELNILEIKCLRCLVGVIGSLLWPGASQGSIYFHRMWSQLSSTCSNLLKEPNGELLVALDHNQQQTMASETVAPIDWSHPPPSLAVLPERLAHSINRCSLSSTGN